MSEPVKVKIVHYGTDGVPLDDVKDVEISDFKSKDELKFTIQSLLQVGSRVKVFDVFNKLINPREFFAEKSPDKQTIDGSGVVDNLPILPVQQPVDIQQSPKSINVEPKIPEKPMFFTKNGMQFKFEPWHDKMYIKDWMMPDQDDYRIVKKEIDGKNKQVIEKLDWVELVDKE